MGQKTIKPIIINELSEKKEEVLKLAKKVAKNLVSISFTENSTNSEFATILEESGPPFKSERFIVVIGAGTSHNAIKNIPLGYCASKKLKTYFNLLSKNDLDAQIANCETEYDAKPIDYPKKISGKFCREIYRTGIEKGNEEIAKLFAQDIEELSQVYRLEKTDFETILLAISKYYPREIYDKLKDISNFRYYPVQYLTKRAST